MFSNKGSVLCLLGSSARRHTAAQPCLHQLGGTRAAHRPRGTPSKGCPTEEEGLATDPWWLQGLWAGMSALLPASLKWLRGLEVTSSPWPSPRAWWGGAQEGTLGTCWVRQAGARGPKLGFRPQPLLWVSRDSGWADRDPGRLGPRIGRGTGPFWGFPLTAPPVTPHVSVSPHLPPQLAASSASQPGVGSAASLSLLCLSLVGPACKGQRWPVCEGLSPHHALEGPTGRSGSPLGPAHTRTGRHSSPEAVMGSGQWGGVPLPASP